MKSAIVQVLAEEVLLGRDVPHRVDLPAPPSRLPDITVLRIFTVHPYYSWYNYYITHGEAPAQGGTDGAAAPVSKRQQSAIKRKARGYERALTVVTSAQGRRMAQQ